MQNETSDRKSAIDKKELVALSFSILVIVVEIVYWGIQIKGVIEMLEMAYG